MAVRLKLSERRATTGQHERVFISRSRSICEPPPPNSIIVSQAAIRRALSKWPRERRRKQEIE